MRRWTIYITLLLILSAASTQHNEIIWNKSASLDWNDFSHQPANEHFTALTVTGISYAFTEEHTYLKIEVYALFDKDESWVNFSQASEELLIHERLHFDITELWTRKLRKSLTQSTSLDASALGSLYDEHILGLTMMQENYDSESHHSLNKENQKKWEMKIQQQLDSLERYQAEVIIKMKPIIAQQ